MGHELAGEPRLLQVHAIAKSKYNPRWPVIAVDGIGAQHERAAIGRSQVNNIQS
ncbi:hypothetical protein [Rosistilla oblonga]|uniref:hypothetical protein n=1 Tax=Rosistilla oblonga TaxID=2527990 RepID=UPI0018D24B8E|nr:hypothetical protein [Rosistilla oblonga]